MYKDETTQIYIIVEFSKADVCKKISLFYQHWTALESFQTQHLAKENVLK